MKSSLAPEIPSVPFAPSRRTSPFAAFVVANGLATMAATAQTALPAIATPDSSADPDDDVIELARHTVEGSRTPQLASPKFNAPLLDTPQTLTVIPQSLMQEQAASSLRDVLRNSPGITFQAGEGGTPAGDQMTIRGFSARTDMFIDGVRDLGGYSRDAFNLEQVEVAKGPSSASAGRGSTGGSINMVTKSPQAVPFSNATLGLGTDNYKRASLDLNRPLNADQNRAFRLNAMWQDAGVPGRNVVENKSWAVAPSLALGLDQPTKLTFAYQRLEQDNIPDYGMPRATFDYTPPVPFENWYGLKQRDYENIEQDLATVTVEHTSPSGFTLRNLTRYGHTYRDSVITSPRFLSGTTDTIRRSDVKSRDQVDEIFANQTHFATEFATGDINHAISAGLEISRETERNYTRADRSDTVLPNTDVYSPNPDDAYDGAFSRTGAYNDGAGDTVALYAFDNIFAGQRWQIFAGLRYDDFRATHDVVDTAGAKTSYERRDREFSGRLGGVFKPTEDSSIYFGYANSFNPSAEGLSLRARRTDLSQVDPEQTNAYELGLKWNALEGHLSLSAGLFRTEKTNARTAGINPNDPPIVLDGRERVDGIEFTAAGRLMRGWDVFAGLALMDSELEATNTAGAAGNTLGLVPKKTFNLWTSYDLPAGFTIGGGSQYMASVFRNDTSGETVPSYWLLNAMVGYEVNEDLTLRLNATNLTDEAYVDRVGGGHHIPGNARQFILSAFYQF